MAAAGRLESTSSPCKPTKSTGVRPKRPRPKRAFRKGLAWIPAGHILRMSPPLIMEEPVAAKAMDIIDEAIGETEKELLG